MVELGDGGGEATGRGWERAAPREGREIVQRHQRGAHGCGRGGRRWCREAPSTIMLCNDHFSLPHKLFSVLTSLPLSIPSTILTSSTCVLSYCGPSLSLDLPLFSFLSPSLSSLPLSPSLHSSLLSLLSHSCNFSVSWSLLHLLQTHHPYLITPDLFVLLIHIFVKSHLISKDIHVLNKMPGFDCHPEDHIFSCLLDALAKDNAIKEAAKLFDEMHDKFPPKLKNFTSLLYSWCTVDKMDEAKFVLV